MRLMAKRIAWLCLFLIFGSAVAFVAHHHSDAAESVKCTVCVAAHSASPRALSIPARAIFVAISTFRIEPVVSAKQHLIAFALSVRPPPEL